MPQPSLDNLNYITIHLQLIYTDVLEVVIGLNDLSNNVCVPDKTKYIYAQAFSTWLKEEMNLNH